MRAVLVGGNGFIGSHLVDALLSEGWEIVVYDRAPERYRPPLPAVEYVHGELGNVGMLSTVLPRADVVFHLASTTIPQSSNDSPVFDIQSNLVDTVRFLEVCVSSRIKKLVFLSSGGTVYGIPGALPVTEDDPTNPICSYGITKLAIEKYIQLFHRLHELPYVILRPSNPFGPRQNPIGQQGAVAAFLGSIARGLPVTVWGDGEVARDYLHVSDLARACLAAGAAETSASVLNIASGRATTLNQLLDIIALVVGQPFRVVRLPGRAFDVPRLALDGGKAGRQLGWSPQVAMEDGLRDTWRWVGGLEWLHRVP